MKEATMGSVTISWREKSWQSVLIVRAHRDTAGGIETACQSEDPPNTLSPTSGLPESAAISIRESVTDLVDDQL